MKRKNSFQTFEKELQYMRRLNLQTVRKSLLVMMSLAFLSFAVPALAQNSTTTTTQGGGGSAQQQTSQKEVSTTTTTQKQTATRIDPLWLILGGIGVLAILLIIILASRGRSNTNTRVRESTTVIKE
jgi:beta-lactamase regulating signal transducer with metallopeptidase domain